MNKKILMIICLILFISIAGVSATDNTDQTIDGNADDLVSSMDALSASQSDNELVGSPDNGTFTDLQNKIDDADAGSTIYLENDYAYNYGFQTDAMVINKQITIEGNGHIIDALGQSRIFNINSPGITLNNITFKNGYTIDGGAILQGDFENATISNCDFINGTATRCSYGGSGAIHGNLKNSILYKCNFINNTATAGYDLSGGAIGSGTIINTTILKCNFINNTATSDASCAATISVWDSIYNTTFSGSFIDNKGGLGILSMWQGTFENSTFTNSIILNNYLIHYWNGIIGDNNWFGNTASNYNNKPEYNPQAWLFLDGSSNPISGSNNKHEIEFNLNNLYNASSNLISHPDMVNFPDVVFELSATNGYLNKYSAALGETIVFTSTINQEGKVTAKIGDVSYTINVTNLKLDAPDVNKYYNGSEMFVVTLSDSSLNPVSNNTVNITINGQTTYGVTDNNGQVAIPLDLNPGNYTVITTTNGLKAFSIVNIYSTIASSDVSGIYQNTRFEAIILDSTGNTVTNKKIKFNINDVELNGTTDADGVVEIDIDLDVGNYVITSTNPVTGEIKTNIIDIIKADSAIHIMVDTSQPYSATLTANISPENLSGDVQFIINGNQQYFAEVVNSKATLKFDEYPAGTYALVATYLGDKNHFESTVSSTFKVTKVIPNIQINAENVTLGENLVVNVILPEDIANPVNVSAGQYWQMVSLNNGVGNATFTDLPPMTYKIVVSYGGDDKYEQTSANTKAKVNKFSTDITVSADSVLFGENLIVTVVLPSDVAYRATVTIANTTKLVSLTNGVGSATFKDLEAGTYDVIASYGGDSRYDKASATTTATVEKISTNIKVKANAVSHGENLIVNITLPDNVMFRASVSIGNTTKLVSLNNGKGTAIFKDLDAGTYNITTTYNGDKNYLKTTVNTTAKVKKASLNMTVSAKTIGKDLVVNVKLPDDVLYRPSVTIGNETIIVSLKNGEGTATFKNLTAGTYNILTTYNGDKNYLKTTVNTTVQTSTNPDKISAPIEVVANAISYGENLVVTVVLPSDVAYRATVTIANTTKFVSLNNGVGSVTFKGLDAGTYTLTAAYGGDSKYLKTSVNTNIKVNKISATITASAETINYGDDLVVNIKLPTDVTRRVSVTICNETKLVTLTNGKASVTFKNINAGTHDVVISYNGDGNYIKSNQTITAKVNKANPNIEITANNITYGKTLTVKVKLPATVSKSAVVVIGSQLKNVTLENGVGTVKFSDLYYGFHIVNVFYEGDENYNSSFNYTMTYVKAS